MSRTCATALALVNWKGVFYERYLLDRHVTALEGANGAGKTTVMIAAYVVLLPDLARLRFTNLGETAATGGDRGIYGRLGEPGMPSYAAMEFVLAGGARAIAGVQLVRKAEPSLELTPFLVTGIDVEGSLKRILLVSTSEHDHVPGLDDVRAAVVRLGGKMQVFGTAKDYFSALFERGITPLRLATEEERAKLHDMLRTSMTGGISRALTSELRSFLLKEETGLADTLVRMRKNLDACRRTRTEVAEASALERDITDVHSAGYAMFCARVAALRGALEEARATRLAAEARVSASETDCRALERELASIESERLQLVERMTEVGRAIDERTALRTRVVAAQALGERLAATSDELTRKTMDAACAADARARAMGAREQARSKRERARDAYDKAARGLGDLQAGLDEFHRRSHAQRLARARLEEARTLLGTPELSAETAHDALVRVRVQLERLDTSLARAARDAALENVRREERASALSALEEIVPSPLSESDDVYDVARRELARLAAIEHLASRRGSLERELELARNRAAAARDVLERAASSGIALDVDDPRSALTQALDAVDAELRRAETNVREELASADRASRDAADAHAEAEALEARVPKWEALVPALTRLGSRGWMYPTGTSEASVRSIEDLVRVRNELTAARDCLRDEVVALEGERSLRIAEADALERNAGVPPELLAVRDTLCADLLATRFEASDADEGLWLEAALGPLVRALVVPDPGLAAEALAELRDAPETVWLVAEDDVPRIVDRARAHLGSRETVDVVVEEAHAIRVSRRPASPVLGRAARANRAAELCARAESVGVRMTSALEEARVLEALVRDADRVLAEAVVLSGGDPAPAVLVARRREAEACAREAAARERARAEEERATAMRARHAAIQALVIDAHQVGGARLEIEAQVQELSAAVDEASRAADLVVRTAGACRVLAQKIDALREVPSAGEASAEFVRIEAERGRYFAAEMALIDVSANKDALGWTDLDADAVDGGVLRETLEAQHASARVALDAAEAALHAAESEAESASVTWQTIEAQRSSFESMCARLRAELSDKGGDELCAFSVDELDRELAALVDERNALADRERASATSMAVVHERRVHIETIRAAAQKDLASTDRLLEPAEVEWRSFTEVAEAAGVLSPGDPVDARSPAEHLAEARAQRALLLARLGQVRGGADGEAAVRAAFARAGEHSDGPSAYLEAWLAARGWAMRRLPAQFADVAEPASAIERLRADLASLSARVERQQAELRGTSEDVARGIDVQLRKTASRVRRLNRDLENVAFGSVAAVRVHVRRVERMDLVLRALRGGDVQELLFQSDMPLEEALAEVFRRYGGGGRAGAAKVLDYREYVDLVVEIQRRGKTEWEVASPTRLSTGEAIGVGAALMMVVLTEWERDANLLRTDRATSTLRFLFLDEANRLSPDNLGTLFDLCRVLDLQLLVAAPEVARAQGNTTYRLVRHVDASGHEEVLVSGRRAALPCARPMDS